jgi:polysaccharide pyruvyl transferase WcaK-like protein
MMPYIEDSDAVLSVGGDNYSLDYGIPKLFTGLDDIALSKNKPLILWGSSIGPFDSLPTYKPYILKHLQSATAILARESTTIEYLEKNGVKDNVYRVADPAYLLEPEKPADENKDVSIDDDSIGINFSPLMAKYACGRDMDLWKRLAAKIVCDIAKKTRRTIYLVPHVTTPDSNDYLFMRNMMSHIGSTEEVHLIGPTYNAAETKWIISKMSFFAGARTHSTIAALSSRVPTLSFAYSMKATGINKDLFGHNSYCLSPNMLDSNTVVEKVVSMIANEDKIIDTLDGSIPIMQEMAMNAGKYLVNVLEE